MYVHLTAVSMKAIHMGARNQSMPDPLRAESTLNHLVFPVALINGHIFILSIYLNCYMNGS